MQIECIRLEDTQWLRYVREWNILQNQNQPRVWPDLGTSKFR